MIKTEKGTWFRLEEPKGFPLRPRSEIISRIRLEGGTVEDSAPIAVYISNDKNEIFYAVDSLGSILGIGRFSRRLILKGGIFTRVTLGTCSTTTQPKKRY